MDLPEDCISNIISFTSPRDACTASMVSRDFKSSSESDTVWENLLPPDYKEIISKSVGPPLNFASKKELFLNLCHSPILIDDGKLSFWLNKTSGRKCYMLCARELSIAWKDTPIYWSWTSMPESRFSEVAELRYVFWLDIKGRMQAQMLSLQTTYVAYLVFRVAEDSYGLEGGANASVGFAEGTSITSNARGIGTSASDNLTEPEPVSRVYFTPDPNRFFPTRRGRPRPRRQGITPKSRPDGWMEIFLGEILNDEGDGVIEMQVSETRVLNAKKGLILEGIELRPKEDELTILEGLGF